MPGRRPTLGELMEAQDAREAEHRRIYAQAAITTAANPFQVDVRGQNLTAETLADARLTMGAAQPPTAVTYTNGWIPNAYAPRNVDAHEAPQAPALKVKQADTPKGEFEMDAD